MRFVVFLPTMLLLCTSWVCALDKSGLVMYLPFDEGNGTVARDASGNGNDGELLGGSEWVDGHFGKGVHLQVAEAMNGVLLSVTPRDLLTTMWGNVKTGF